MEKMLKGAGKANLVTDLMDIADDWIVQMVGDIVTECISFVFLQEQYASLTSVRDIVD